MYRNADLTAHYLVTYNIVTDLVIRTTSVYVHGLPPGIRPTAIRCHRHVLYGRYVVHDTYTCDHTAHEWVIVTDI